MRQPKHKIVWNQSNLRFYSTCMEAINNTVELEYQEKAKEAMTGLNKEPPVVTID